VRLHFVVEDQTEEAFVRDLLCPEMALKGIYCDAHRVTTGRRGGKVFRGGLLSYTHLRKDLDLWMKQDGSVDSWFTTMVDVYRLPSDFPGMQKSGRLVDPVERVQLLEQALGDDIGHARFVPYLQLHEFEALLFSNPEAFFIAFPALGNALDKLQAIRQSCATPEHIDDRPDYAPSRQILRILPDYDKAVSGPLIAREIGLARLRAECRHFDAWLTRLESIEQE
jgi:hypothetical protein